LHLGPSFVLFAHVIKGQMTSGQLGKAQYYTAKIGTILRLREVTRCREISV